MQDASTKEPNILTAMQAAFIKRYQPERHVFDLERMKRDLSSAVATRDFTYNRLRLDLERFY
ncbi:hypothetical protein KHA80_12345 [Anaerobacillus sp. HL2]|nr:hypothetical protein KHA80_12345 [Anaerobacillus sp. HL2]